jgi:hypothetical protein
MSVQCSSVSGLRNSLRYSVAQWGRGVAQLVSYVTHYGTALLSEGAV